MYSEPGKGTTFHVYMPLIESGSQETETMPGGEVPGGDERILVVDDEEQLVRMIDEMLTRLGYSITAVTRGLEALELFREEPENYDLVITDMTMTGLSGSELSVEILRIRY